MNTTIKTINFKLLLILILIWLPTFAVAADSNTSSSNIEIINQLQNDILIDNNKLSKLEQDIKKLDEQISEKTQNINKQDETIKKIINAKLNLQYKKTEELDNLNIQQKQLFAQLKSTYIIHRNNNLQSLVNINDISQLQRVINYLESFNNQSSDKITAIKTALNQIEQLDNNLNFLNSQQQEYKQKLAINLNSLNLLKANNLKLKQNLIASLDKNKSSLDYYHNLDVQLASHAAGTNKHTNKKVTLSSDSNIDTDADNLDLANLSSLFAKAKGKLIQPVAGYIDHNFKNPNNRKAIFIKTPEGQNVKAVFDGKVVFANWMRGFGYLTIIDHQDGFMSLYGHNQTLFKTTGERIKAGDVIALTGASGGIAEPGLYFEIRHNGNTINPLAWLKLKTERNDKALG